MRLREYGFNLPQELIRQYPVIPRDDCRLMVAKRSTQEIIIHDKFKTALFEYFSEGDTFVFNDSYIFPAKLKGMKEKNTGEVEVLLLRELKPSSFLWDVIVHPARKIRVGNKLYFGKYKLNGEEHELIAEVVDNTTAKGRIIRFLFQGDSTELNYVIDKLGKPPLPNYIKREPNEDDFKYFQNVYADPEKRGSVSPPSGGFRFTKNMLKRMELLDINTVFLTLHCGIAGFSSVQVEDLSKHKMESDYFEIPEETARVINETRARKKQVCVVGASTFRAVESSVSPSGLLKPVKRWTELFLFAPYTPKIPTAYITGFHLPKSIEMMATGAFAGFKLMKKIYKTALKENFAFGVYGDVLLII